MSFVDAFEDRATRPSPNPAASGSKISPANSGAAVPTTAKPEANVISADDFESVNYGCLVVMARADE
jgi:hypothetical protein